MLRWFQRCWCRGYFGVGVRCACAGGILGVSVGVGGVIDVGFIGACACGVLGVTIGVGSFGVGGVLGVGVNRGCVGGVVVLHLVHVGFRLC